MIGTKVIVRTRDAGVHSGTFRAVDGDVVALDNARRLWRWWAAKSISLSAVALHGVKSRPEVKIAGKLSTILIRGWCEIMPCTDGAAASIDATPEANAS